MTTTQNQSEIKIKQGIVMRIPSVFITKNRIFQISLSLKKAKAIISEGYVIVVIPKDKLKRSETKEDLYPWAYLCQCMEKVIPVGSGVNVIISESESEKQRLQLKVINEVRIHEFDPKTQMISYSVLHLKKDDCDFKLMKKEIIGKLDKVLQKLTISELLPEFYGISSLEELINSIFSFLLSKRAIAIEKAESFFMTLDMKDRLKIIEEALESYYYSTDISIKNISGRQQIQGRVNVNNLLVGKYRKFLDEVQGMTDEVKEEITKKIGILESIKTESSEKASLQTYLDTVVSIPWGKHDESQQNINKMKVDLDEIQYGMEEAKDRLIEYLAVSLNKKVNKGPILCLIGSPGTGKTLFAQNAAKILKRKCTSIPLGGIDDVTILRGQRRGWIGAEPGQITKALIRAKSMNPVIILDEIDKISGHRGDQVRAALLEILDPNQNNEFKDAYMEIPLDLSQILFIATANYYSGLPLALYNRLEIIHIDPYSILEKNDITKQFIIPGELRETGLSSEDLIIEDEVVLEIVKNFKFDGGMRRIKQTINKLLRKFLVEKLKNPIDLPKPFIINQANIANYIELDSEIDNAFDPLSSIVGEINVLSVLHDDTGSVVGGKKGSLQINIIKGKGKMVVTGSVQDVFRQSITVAFGYIKSKARELDIADNYFSNHDFYIHAPSTAQRKDGPSAGLGIILATLSAIKNIAIPQNYGITGEVDLRGNALVIGGVKAKINSAYQMGVKTFVLPIANKHEFETEVEEQIKKDIQVYFIGNVSEAIKVFFPDWKVTLIKKP